MDISLKLSRWCHHLWSILNLLEVEAVWKQLQTFSKLLGTFLGYSIMNQTDFADYIFDTGGSQQVFLTSAPLRKGQSSEPVAHICLKKSLKAELLSGSPHTFLSFYSCQILRYYWPIIWNAVHFWDPSSQQQHWQQGRAIRWTSRWIAHMAILHTPLHCTTECLYESVCVGDKE